MCQDEPLQLGPYLAQSVVDRLQGTSSDVFGSLSCLDVLADLKVEFEQSCQSGLSHRGLERLPTVWRLDNELAVDSTVLDGAEFHEDVDGVGGRGTRSGGDGGEEATEGDETDVDGCEFRGE